MEFDASAVIIEATITDGEYENSVMIKCDNGAEGRLFSYYNDELSFSAGEFIGKTVRYARELFHQKDIAYLKS